MRILFTGASSFTGMWFAENLVQAGHTVVAAIQGSKDSYSGLRAERLACLAAGCEMAWGTAFGTPAFLDLIAAKGPFDLFCHHAAEVKDYKSPDFDVEAAVAANTRELPAVLQKLRASGCRHLLLTGSIFEAGEGKGSARLEAFSPYGHSKTRTSEVFRQQAAACDFALGKFVIPNPFGPYEEPRFTEYLMNCWKQGKTAQVRTPAYVRDNVPVTLLAAAYADFAGALPASGFARCNPSCYAQTQGDFARRFAAEMERRLQIAARLEFAEQTDFPEPRIRINTAPLRDGDFGWSEQAFWDETARYYAGRLEIPVR